MNIGRESEGIEFKKSTSETKEGIISIASILNKHGAGILYFGVKDDGTVCGMEIGKDTERKLSRAIAENIHPSVFYQIESHRTPEHLDFIEIQFKGSAAPYSAYGRYYQRFSDEDKQISDIELERLFKARKNDYSEWENTESDEGLQDIDNNLLKTLIARGNESQRIRYPYTDAESIASKLGLYDTKTGKLNNAGKALISKGNPVLLKTALFATETKETFLKLNHFEGNIFACIEEAISFIYSSMSWEVKMDNGAQRMEIPEIPVAAIREIVINAFAHGNYDTNTAFTIEIFSNRIEVYSPGAFPEGFIPEDFAQRAAEPIMLNPKIINVLFKAGEIESFGYGFENTFKLCREANIKYSYENMPTGFRFIFYRNHTANHIYKMSKTEKDVYGMLCKDKNMTNAELAKKLQKSEKTAYRAIKSLKEEGYIMRHGNDRNGYWEILK